MHQENSFLYKEINGTKILSMAYHDSDYALLSIMPSLSKFSTFQIEDFPLMLKGLKPTLLNLYYPRYTFSSRSNFVNVLKQEGMKDAFSQNADFSGISEQTLFISQIIQQTYIAVDENGTEAAAATALSIKTTGISTKAPLEVLFDQPFLFALYHVPTQTILFWGAILNPSNQ
jgi:serpin B